MKRPAHYVSIPNSERSVLYDARLIGRTDSEAMVNVTVYVRKNPATLDIPDPIDLGNKPPLERAHLSAADFLDRYGADPQDLEKVAEFARSHGLEAVEQSVAKRSVRLVGRVSDFEKTFGVALKDHAIDHAVFRIRTGAIYIPPELAGIVEAVFGLDNRRTGAPRLRNGRLPPVSLQPQAIATPRGLLPQGTFFPPDVALLYRYPQGTDGGGECIAILAFNGPEHGGYRIQALRTYFETILRSTTPEITDVVVHGPGNDPGSDSPEAEAAGDSTGEIMLDIQVAGSVAPGAKLAMYFTEFTEQGWVDALNTIITDTQNNPSVISISYGNPEDDPRSAWTVGAILKVTDALRAAAARGFTVCCASGDDGSRDQGGGPRAHADFPASCPFVIGCGGTTVRASGYFITDEVVWNDGPGSATGGGISRLFPLPYWQANANVPPSANPERRIGRGVPDVSGLADPATGVAIITVDGQHLAVAGGTSVTAPLWSALVVRINQALGVRAGYLNPLLYLRLSSGVLRDITRGNNGAYQATAGWDACTGLGSPDGRRLLWALRSPALASLGVTDLRQRVQMAYNGFAYSLANSWTRPDAHARVEDALHRFIPALAGFPGPVSGVNPQGAAKAYADYVRALQFAFWPGVAEQPVRAAYDDFLQTIQESWTLAEVEKLDLGSLAAVTQTLNTAALQTSAALEYIQQRWLAVAASWQYGLRPAVSFQ